jgi:3-oxoacyl-[acyl-carrier protein] reductase
MELNLKGRTAVVTGASKGIGKAITNELAIEGVRILAVARNEQALIHLQQEVVAAGGVAPVIFVQDLVAADGPASIAAKALEALGHVDILINNAGASRAVDVVAPEEPWIAGMTLDFDRHRQLTQQLLPHFIERRQGVILNITSTFELRSLNVSAVAKAAIAQWSKQLAGALGPYGIRVNCLQPGLIDTDNVRGIFPGEERKKFSEREIPLGDFGEPQDMANMATFLVSSRAKYVTGTVAVVDGGLRRYAF